MPFKYLQVIDIAQSSPFTKTGRVKIKSIVMVLNGTGTIEIDCKFPYGWCLLVYRIKYSG